MNDRMNFGGRTLAEEDPEFFAPLQTASPEEYQKIVSAYLVSRDGHEGQTRFNKLPYFTHPRESAMVVMSIGCKDSRTIVDTLLHDLVEDGRVSLEKILRIFGEMICRDVDALTKRRFPQKEPTLVYLGRVATGGPSVILSKLADRFHNLTDMKGHAYFERKKQTDETLLYHIPILISALRTHGDPWVQYADVMSSKLVEAIRRWQ